MGLVQLIVADETTAKKTAACDEAQKQSGKAQRPKRSERARKILHFLSTQSTASPFDINMAIDSGYDIIVPHVNVGLGQTRALVQDAIFSRPPHVGRFTGLFIGGKDALLALDMLTEVEKALVPPFEIRAFADPGGSFTTAAAMVASVERAHNQTSGGTLQGARVAVFGATGVVGYCSAIIAALQGADVTVVSHLGYGAISAFVKEAKRRFGVTLKAALGARDADKVRIVSRADIVLCAAAAGVRVLEDKHLKKAKPGIILADVNAVPPSGVSGIGLFDSGSRPNVSGHFTVGPLAIGDIKYKTHSRLLKEMTTSRQTVLYDFRDAYAVAREIVTRQKNT